MRTKTISLVSMLVLSFVMPTLGQPDVDELLNIGNALYALGKYDEAIRAYDKVTQLNPLKSEAWFNKGIALENLGKYDEAIAAIDKAKELGFTY